MSAGRVSFVVIAYNEASHIERCLDAILALEGTPAHEIVVVDDGSTDETSSIVRDLARRHHAVRLVTQANAGRGAARAAGVAASSGDLVAMVDADIVLPSDWLVRCTAALDDYDAVGGTAVPDGDVAYVHRRFHLEPLAVPATTTVTGNNGLYRRTALTEVPFDPALREGEDVDLNHRLRAHGLRATCLDGLHVEHAEDKTFTESLRWLFESGVGATRQLARYHQVRLPDLAFAGFLATLGVAAGTRRRAVLAVPPLYVTAVAAHHLRWKFALGPGPAALGRFACATVADGALLAAYFAGRTAGLGRWLAGRLEPGTAGSRAPAPA